MAAIRSCCVGEQCTSSDKMTGKGEDLKPNSRTACREIVNIEDRKGLGKGGDGGKGVKSSNETVLEGQHWRGNGGIKH